MNNRNPIAQGAQGFLSEATRFGNIAYELEKTGMQTEAFSAYLQAIDCAKLALKWEKIPLIKIRI